MNLINSTIYSALIALTFLISNAPIVHVFSVVDQNWDINYACQKYIKAFSTRTAEMARCAIENSAPPSVCIGCIDQYINFKQEEYRTQHLDHVFSADNKTCTTVIYENYVLSYSHELALELTNKIWEASRCESCLKIHWDFEHENSTVLDLDNKTQKFAALLQNWRTCVDNVSSRVFEEICKNCTDEYNKLYNHFWKIYTKPDVDFCVDVEAMMNDTFNLWQHVWGCTDPKVDDRQDIRVVAFSATMLIIIIGLFYAGSYIQSEQVQANLIQYSRIQAPARGPRYRLLSSSTLDSSTYGRDAISTTPSSSQHGWTTTPRRADHRH